MQRDTPRDSPDSSVVKTENKRLKTENKDIKDRLRDLENEVKHVTVTSIILVTFPTFRFSPCRLLFAAMKLMA